MQNIVHAFLNHTKIDKRRHLRVVSILLILSLLVSTEVFWMLRQTGITMAGDATCGIEEHTHTGECFDGCDKKEHVHSVDCYADQTADVETQADWQTMFKTVALTGELGKDLAAVAKSQVGYQESQRNYQLDRNGNKQGYTRYGAWYGFPYNDWSAMFVAFCLHYAGSGLEDTLYNIGPDTMAQMWDRAGRFAYAENHTPMLGELIFFSNNSVGIVSSVKFDVLTVVQGNVENEVVERTIMDYDETIVGYGLLSAPIIDSNPSVSDDTNAGSNLPEYGESINGTNWDALSNGDYFTYWEQFMPDAEAPASYQMLRSAMHASCTSDCQIDEYGGTTTSAFGDSVEVSKTIAGTSIENVFDITLTVKTQERISEIYEEPDMAVIIVMDISNTMRADFGDVTRYHAAMDAAEHFIDNFAAQSGDISRIGYVAFNTDAHEIFGLSSCTTAAQAISLKNSMRKETGAIIDASDYPSSHSRFTNIEAGLKMAADMLADAKNEHKYVIFLSDGFPTTYLNNSTSKAYDGYDPYTASGTAGKDGVFYDAVAKVHCDFGTSYSDKAAIRARTQATTMKNSGIKIFSIGVDVGGQTIQKYLPASGASYSVVDRTSTTYEIGSASSTASYVNWLRNSIGSGYYYDSTNADGLQAAYDSIFEEILRLKEEASEADWVAQDPIPMAPPEYLEFIGFYDASGTLMPTSADLSGLPLEGNENTANFTYNTKTKLNTITWDLKQSGYSQTTSGDITTYSYKLVYRVRLKNELSGFAEGTVYDTNAPTSLTYRVFESENNVVILSEQRKIDFKIPAVHGFLSELRFTKQDNCGNLLAGAEFLLTHDTENCSTCRGDGVNHVDVPNYTAVSDASGVVTFARIPSGHLYILEETNPPQGFIKDNTRYSVEVAYDVLTMEDSWNGVMINVPWGILPATGGNGILPFVLLGAVLITIPTIYLFAGRRKRERRSRI